MSRDEGGEERRSLRLEEVLDRLPALDDLRHNQAVRLLLAGVLIGAVAGVAAGVMDRAIVLVSGALLGSAEPAVQSPEVWRRLVAPTVTGLVASAVVLRLMGRRRPQGIPDVLAGVQLREHPLSVRDGLLSASTAVLVVGGGQSGGREGPIVQLAATLAAQIVRGLGVRDPHRRALVAAGGAAAVAASFNTPIAGAFFALEIILGNFAMETFAPVIAATVTGTVVGQALLGDRIALHLPAFDVHSSWEYPLYVVVGAVCGAVGALFKRAIDGSGEAMTRAGVPRWARGGVAGLVVGAIAAAGMPAVMGNGYAFMEALSGHAESYGIGMLALLLVAKIVATAATTAGRSGAGLFAPSLFLGAVTGTLCGETLQRALPTVVLAPGAYGMVGMAAVGAATLHAPITMSLMLFEMTRNYAVVLPLLVAVATASVVSRHHLHESLYDAELRHQGLVLSRGREELVMHDLSVGDIMREDGFETLVAGAPVGDIVGRFLARRTDLVFMVNPDGTLAGAIDIQDAKRFFAAPDEPGATLRPRPLVSLLRGQRLSEAIGAFFEAGVEELPVVSPTGALLGVLAQRDVVAAYNREVLRQSVPLTRVVSDTSSGPRTDFLELPPGQVLELVPVGPAIRGRTLRELALTQAFECVVLAVRSPAADGGPPTRRAAMPDTRLVAGEELVVIGPAPQVTALLSWSTGSASGPPGESPTPT